MVKGFYIGIKLLYISEEKKQTSVYFILPGDKFNKVMLVFG